MLWSHRWPARPAEWCGYVRADEEWDAHPIKDAVPTHRAPSWTVNPRNGDAYAAYNKPAAVIDWLQHNEVTTGFIRFWLLWPHWTCRGCQSCDTGHLCPPMHRISRRQIVPAEHACAAMGCLAATHQSLVAAVSRSPRSTSLSWTQTCCCAGHSCRRSCASALAAPPQQRVHRPTHAVSAQLSQLSPGQ